MSELINARILVPAGVHDELEFTPNPRGPVLGQKDSWHTTWDGVAGLDKQFYSVYPWKTGYAYSRPEHPVLGKFAGSADDRETAMNICAADFVEVARLQRWIEYMKTNEPPSHTYNGPMA
jgi:hypothetical protein